MKVEINLNQTSQCLVHDAENTYQKGSMFCVKVGDKVYKYPMNNIWRVCEDYNNGEAIEHD